MLNAKALFLINDQQSQIPKSDIFRQQPMGANDNINGAVLKPLDRFLVLMRCLESRQQPDFDWKVRKPFFHRVKVLLG